jgi:hypothetical protein
MKPNEIFESVNKFFIDIVSSIIPGFILILGLRLLLAQPSANDSLSLVLPQPKDNTHWILLIIISYIVGHGITSFGENIVLGAFEYFIEIL